MQPRRHQAPDSPLHRQMGALARRRRLQAQQEQLGHGAIGYEARPPYPSRPRPPG